MTSAPERSTIAQQCLLQKNYSKEALFPNPNMTTLIQLSSKSMAYLRVLYAVNNPGYRGGLEVICQLAKGRWRFEPYN